MASTLYSIDGDAIYTQALSPQCMLHGDTLMNDDYTIVFEIAQNRCGITSRLYDMDILLNDHSRVFRIVWYFHRWQQSNVDSELDRIWLQH